MRLFLFGYGFSGRAMARRMAGKGWEVFATYRDDAGAARIAADGHRGVDLGDRDAVTEALSRASALLVTAPPGPQGCPGLNSLVGPLAQAGAFPDWIGYLSTTGVYGDRRGGWVTEESRLAAQSVEGARRVGAERDWWEVGRGMGLTVCVFRLPGIYGPGRSAFDRLREGRARRIVAEGQVFSRIHVDDLAAGLEASIARPRAGAAYNLCDDEPAPNSEVIAHAARLLGLEPPPEVRLEDAQLTPAAMRFYAESKRVSNARAKAELGWRPRYPTYREGLAAILAPPLGELPANAG
ncbi:MAG: NAD(P)-dependent oxidoreductase [Phenylobacterium sp. RIFCSPHIGHO2_01_FULL_69_31]|uniref:SDR family oxidoreductase n=1 Tax=Phenylobacterium sp. RIFCSPHIGHO2_01_FULL_69_31 TaxID=1801944 RepID=UPI0008D1AB8F|nr:SDR family oxidoreductase [Phenylobacterium sp. RIFCSPHIGHO2_01_FULL_69_31]OHB30603.1 MAG: NAD(P)-dependent oxidoreductase [Phenylobacterium sp. RIFCSPHIGHO2_01_FULL_69_31]